MKTDMFPTGLPSWVRPSHCLIEPVWNENWSIGMCGERHFTNCVSLSNRTSLEWKRIWNLVQSVVRVSESHYLIEPVWNENRSPLVYSVRVLSHTSHCLIEPVWNENYSLKNSCAARRQSHYLIEPVWNENTLVGSISLLPQPTANTSHYLIEPVWNQNICRMTHSSVSSFGCLTV